MPIQFRPESFARRLNDGDFADGFVLRFNFGSGDIVDLAFDGSGVLVGADEPITTQDLLDGTAVQKMRDAQ